MALLSCNLTASSDDGQLGFEHLQKLTSGWPPLPPQVLHSTKEHPGSSRPPSPTVSFDTPPQNGHGNNSSANSLSAILVFPFCCNKTNGFKVNNCRNNISCGCERTSTDAKNWVPCYYCNTYKKYYKHPARK